MPSQTLKDAYYHIKQGEKSTARDLLQPYVKQHPNDANGWWLMAHAAKHPDQRRHYIERVLELAPDHAPAQKALRKLHTETSTPRKKKNTDKKKSDRTETIIGIALIVSALVMIACGGLFFAVSRGASTFFNEIAQNITVESSSGGSVASSNGGAFSGYMWDVNVQGAIAVGQSVEGTLNSNSAFEDDGWTMEGRSGQRVTIEVNALGSLDPQVYLYSPTGEELAHNDDIELMENRDSRVQVTLPETGTYGIVVTEFGFDGGRYRLSVR